MAIGKTIVASNDEPGRTIIVRRSSEGTGPQVDPISPKDTSVEGELSPVILN